MKSRIAVSVAALSVALIVLAGCANEESPPPASTEAPPASETPSKPEAPSPSSPAQDTALYRPAGTPQAIATDLDVPWSILRLEDGSTLISQRDTGSIVELDKDGLTTEIGTIPGVVAGGEGGLLGITVDPETPDVLYAYFTAAGDNRVVRIPLLSEAGSRTLGEAEPLVTGIPKAQIHNGGRIAFGPDGALYITTGDAGNGSNAQDPASLGGKILRINPDGSIPDDNPTEGSAVYTLGHRNPEGIAWTSDGRLWASEFGEVTWDELNLIKAGANYGWPETEGIAGDARFQDPVAQWTTAEASPSGLVAIGNTLFMASLRGERIWTIDVDRQTAATQAWFVGEYGRIRDVVVGPDNTLWFITNNTDGRGAPAGQDDVLYSVDLNVVE